MTTQAQGGEQCSHDLADPNHTLTVRHDLREGREFASTALCQVCGRTFRHPLHPDYQVAT